MLELIKNLLGFGPKINYKELVKQGAIILDVRTSGEYQQGKIKGSVNIPVQALPSQLSKLNKQKTIITCCASGARSAAAKSILKANGFNEVHNAGSWISLHSQLS